MQRSDYKSTILNIREAFERDQVHFEFYEKIFYRQDISKLEDFLGFSLEAVDFSERVNQSDEELLDDDLTSQLLDLLSPQYEFCRAQFPEVEELWPRYADL